MTTDPDFDEWLKNVEDATGLNINVIAAPTDSDTRQQKAVSYTHLFPECPDFF